MGATRRRFTEEYKEQAVAFVIDGNRSMAEVARNIGVHEMTLGKWVKKAREARAEQTSADEPLEESERVELVRRRAESKDYQATIAELQMQAGVRKKSSGLVRERPAVKFAAIADWAASKEYPVDFMCRELGVSSSGYYAWLKATPSQRATDDADLIPIMNELHADRRG